MLSRLVEDKSPLASPPQRESVPCVSSCGRERKNAEEIIGREKFFNQRTLRL